MIQVVPCIVHFSILQGGLNEVSNACCLQCFCLHQVVSSHFATLWSCFYAKPKKIRSSERDGNVAGFGEFYDQLFI